MINWVGMGFGIAATGAKLGSDIASIGAGILRGAAEIGKINANIMDSRSRELSMQMQEKNFRKAAGDAVKAAGRIQEAGRQSRESRLIVLGQTKGAITASAAGSGIDVSSKTVNKVLKDTIRSAWNDAETIAKNEREQAQQKINESQTAVENAIWMRYNLKVEGINQQLMFEQRRLQSKANQTALIGGVLSAGANLAGGVGRTAFLSTMT